jgi:oligopeptide transport system substrate-binding protein
MELAKTELKLQQWPPLVLLARDSPLERKIAEYLQQLLQTGLGIPTRIDIQVFKQALEKMNTGDFDIVITGWGADFDDPITFGDLFASWNINNRGRYNSAQYDALVRAAYASADQSERMQLFAQMQQHVIDDVPILPMFESTEIYAVNPQLRGVTRALYSGDIDFRFAYLEGPQK